MQANLICIVGEVIKLLDSYHKRFLASLVTEFAFLRVLGFTIQNKLNEMITKSAFEALVDFKPGSKEKDKERSPSANLN